MLKISILDGYIDEPTCLGVPPYISPYPRYIAGAIWDFDKSAQIFYVTIDQIRNNYSLVNDLSESDIVIVIAGMSVPGIMEKLSKPTKILCGPAAHFGFGISGGKKTRETSFIEDFFDLIIKGDGETVLYDFLDNKCSLEKIDNTKCRKNSKAVKDFAVKGSNVVKQHPFYPDYLIAEIETYRGCPRSVVANTRHR